MPFEVPESWCWESLSDVCNVARGGSPRPIKEYLTDDKNGINWIKIGDADKDGKYINSTKEKISPSGVSKSRMVHKGDFLLTNSMSFGRPYILNIDGCIHDGWLVISPIPKTYDPEFLYYLLSSGFAYSQFTEAASGGVVSNLNSDKVGNSLFPLPPQSEQKRIVSELEKLFKAIRLIDNNKLLIRHNIEQIRSKILELAISGKLVHQNTSDEPAIELLKRINPAYKPADNRHYENLPETWEEVELGAICQLFDGKKVTDKELINLDVKYLRGSKEGDKLSSGKYVPKDALMILVDGENSGEVFITPHEGYQGSTFKQLNIYPELNRDYVLLLIQHSRELLKDNKVGSAIPHLNKKLFKLIHIPIPPYNEQERIVQTVRTITFKLDKILAYL